MKKSKYLLAREHSKRNGKFISSISQRTQWLPICHLPHIIEMENFRRKVCLVAEDHVIQMPNIIINYNMVTIDTVFIVLTMAGLHDLEVKAADALNDYVMASNREKIWTVIGSEF